MFIYLFLRLISPLCCIRSTLFKIVFQVNACFFSAGFCWLLQGHYQREHHSS